MTARPPRVLAIASGGGHWAQLMRLRPAWDDCDVTYVTTLPGYRDRILAMSAARGQRRPEVRLVADAHRPQWLRLSLVLVQVAWILIRVRPDAVISTGAAPGAIAVRLGARLGCRTVWVDSIANAEAMSESGAYAGPHADLWLTQWSDLARPGGPEYRGSVL